MNTTKIKFLDNGDYSIVDDDHDEADTHRNAPTPAKACFYGQVGEIAEAGSEHTEASPIAIAANVLALLSAAIGPAVYLPVGDSWQHVNLFWAHVGQSGSGRKGTAKSLPLGRILRAMRAKAPKLAPQTHDGGLSSGEGVALMIHDGWNQGENKVEPIADKRLLVILEEFDSLLTVARREGNTLSAIIRGLWDGKSIRPATKSSQLWATHPHVSLSVDITPQELRERLSKRDLSNGFANRFVFFYANRTKMVPNPKPTAAHEVELFAQALLEVIEFAGISDGTYERDSLRMELSSEAAQLYMDLYLSYGSTSSGDLIDSLLVRRPAVLCRIAMIFALTDKTLMISAKHIEAAAAWVQFWTDSVMFIFSSEADQSHAEMVGGMAQKVMSYLSKNGRVTRTDLSRNCFGGNATKSEIDQVIDQLLHSAPPQIVVDTVPSPGNRPTKFYSVRKKVDELNEFRDLAQPCGLQLDSSKTNSTKPTNLVESDFVSSSAYEQPKPSWNPHESTDFVVSSNSYAQKPGEANEVRFRSGSAHLNTEIL